MEEEHTRRSVGLHDDTLAFTKLDKVILHAIWVEPIRPAGSLTVQSETLRHLLDLVGGRDDFGRF